MWVWFSGDMILLKRDSSHHAEEPLCVKDQLACMDKIQLSTIIVDYCSAW